MFDPRAFQLRRQLRQVREKLVQRRVQQPDRHRQALHRLEHALEVLLLQRQQVRERVACARRVSSAMIIVRIFGWRSSAMNMCSVRHRPMPSAPSSRAFFASSGVSAFVRTPSRRMSSAQPSTVSKDFEDLVEGGVLGGVDERDVVERDLAVGAVDGDEVAGLDRPCRRRGCSAARGRSCSSDAAVTHGTPMPRATSAAWLALPPRLVRMPLAAWKPATSLAFVSGPDEDDGSRPSAGGLDGLLGREDDLALGARRARRRRPWRCTS